MKNIIGLALLICGVINIGFAQKDKQALEVLDNLSQKYKKMNGFNASFEYILDNQDEDLNEALSGTILVKGKKYKLDMGSQIIYNDNQSVWTYIPDAEEVNVSEYDPEDQQISLSNIFEIYKSGFKYLINGDVSTDTDVAVDLVPEDVSTTYFKIRMTINKASNELKSFRLFEKSGNRYLYKVVKFEELKSVSDREFRFDEKAFPSVEVIDFR